MILYFKGYAEIQKKVTKMNFENLDWADIGIDKIEIKYDRVKFGFILWK